MKKVLKYSLLGLGFVVLSYSSFLVWQKLLMQRIYSKQVKLDEALSSIKNVK
jgi:hypothetical protein